MRADGGRVDASPKITLCTRCCVSVYLQRNRKAQFAALMIIFLLNLNDTIDMLQDDGHDNVGANLLVGIFTAVVIGWIADNITAGIMIGYGVFLFLHAIRND